MHPDNPIVQTQKISSNRRRVVVTGYGLITSLGPNAEETFQNTAAGRSGIDYLTAFDTRDLPCTIGGQVPEEWLVQFDSDMPRRSRALASRGLRLMEIATREAAGQAGLDRVGDRNRLGVSLGSHGESPPLDDIRFLHRFFDGRRWDMPTLRDAGGYSLFQFFRRKPDVATALLSMLFECKGPNLSIVSACSAGSQAIGEAVRIIREGQADVMIAGGCEAALNFISFLGFVHLRAMVEKFTTPQTASRPFDRKRNGFVMAEGAGAVILEGFDHAQKRGAKVLGEVLGYGDSADAYRITDCHPNGLGAVLAMRAALADAGLSPDRIDYINAHGTSTTLNDQTETRAIKEVFGERAKQVPISSNKSMLGHAIAAAGAIECVLTLMGMAQGVILPTINYEYPDPKCDLDYVPNTARRQVHHISLSNSFGFGGQNACLCLRC